MAKQTLTAPRGMDPSAKAVWKQVASLHPHLKPADGPMLAEFCRMYAQFDRALAALEETEILATSSKGTPYLSPAMQAVAALENRVLRWARALGLVHVTRPKGTATVPQQPASETTPILGTFKVTA